MSNSHTGRQDDILTTVGADFRLAHGTRLAGRFEVIRVLGQGGQAQVYQVHDTITDDTLAVKILGQRNALSEHEIQVLREELLAARKISDPHVIRAHEFYRDENVVFYTMDFIQGETLAQRLSRTIPVELAEQWIQHLLRAVQACHRAQRVHGDIKPANLLITENEQLILADFGISAPEHQRSLLGQGSGEYRAPESLDGDVASRAVDVFATGKVIQRILVATQKRTPRDWWWYRRWRRIATQMTAPTPEKRPPLKRYLSDDARQRHLSVLVASLFAFFVVVVGWHIIQIQSEDSVRHESEDSVVVQQVQRLAFIAADDTPATQRLVELLVLRYIAAPESVVTSQARIEQLQRQLDLRPADSARDRQRLSGLINASYLIFIRALERTDADPEGFQLFISQHPENQIVGSYELIYEGSVLTTLDQVSRYLNADLGKVATQSNTEIPAALTEVLFALQAIEQERDRDGLVQTYAETFSDVPAFWFHLAQHAFEREHDNQAREYLTALFDLTSEPHNHYWLLQGRVLESKLDQDFERAANTLDQLLDRYPDQLRLLDTRAQIAQQLDQIDRAEQLLQRAISLDPQSGYRWFELGRLRINQGEIQAAINEELAQGLLRFQQQEDRAGQGTILNAYGVAYLRLGDLDNALQSFERALEARQAAGDLTGQAVTLGNMANVLAILQKYDAADARLAEAMQIFLTLQDYRGRAQVLNERGYLAEEQGRYVDALRYFRDALDLRVRYGSTEEQAETIGNVAFVHYLSGDYSQADVFWRQAYTLYERIGLQSGMLRTELQLSNLHLQRGEYQTATRLLARLSEDIDERRPIEKAYLYYLLSHRNFELGYPRAAREHIDVALNVAMQTGDIRAIVENGLWALEMCFWLADIACFEQYQAQLMTYEQGFTAEQATIFDWLQRLTAYLTDDRQVIEPLGNLLVQMSEMNLPIQPELRIRLSLWEFAPELLLEHDKRQLLQKSRSSFYRDHLHAHFLALRDGLISDDEYALSGVAVTDYWRAHVFTGVLQQPPIDGDRFTEWLDGQGADHRARYSCWFLGDCL